MNTREYIGYVDSIAHLSEAEQEELLEQARYEAFCVLKLSGISAIYRILSFLPTLILAVLANVVTEYSLFATPIAIGVGLLLSRPLSKRLQGKLLKQGLNSLTAKSAD